MGNFCINRKHPDYCDGSYADCQDGPSKPTDTKNSAEPEQSGSRDSASNKSGTDAPRVGKVLLSHEDNLRASKAVAHNVTDTAIERLEFEMDNILAKLNPTGFDNYEAIDKVKEELILLAEQFAERNYISKARVLEAINDMYEMSITDLELHAYQEGTEKPVISKTDLISVLNLNRRDK